MGFEEIKDSIKKSYRTPDNIVGDFYIPLLSRAKFYDRAVGFFSSSILIELSRGLIKLIKNGGKMRLITSPNLSEEDIEAIDNGYASRDEILKKVERAIMQEWKEPKNHIEEERLNFLSHLIEEGHLDIKIAFKKPIGLYHEKIGIITDEKGNSVAFIGSLNESKQATRLNFESIDAYTSWGSEDSLERVNDKIDRFEETWNNLTESLEVIDFPQVAREKLQSYKKEHYNENIDEEEKEYRKNDPQKPIIEHSEIEKPKNVPMIPELTEKFKGLHEYQANAIKEWKERGYCGIFDMATGTGKTYTGLGALVELYNYCNSDLAVVICCPFIHLVEQWVEDLKKFNIEPIIGYGDSSKKNWKEKLTKTIMYHNYGIDNKKFFCFITTNKTFYSDFVQKELNKIKGNSLLMVDEAHYFGAKCIREKLPERFKYRLALSATIQRHGDDEGTDAIFNYFGDKCIEYTLRMAIDAGMLTNYKYYIVPISLTERELIDYRDLTAKIAKIVAKSDNKKQIPESAKPLLLKRARLIAGAENKLVALKDLMVKHKNEFNMLIYCGATTLYNPDANEADSIRQIDEVCNILGNELKMKVHQFTSKESIKERIKIKNLFANRDLNALVAIKCLDEGFNIPEIETAFILASTTNPKEYIQRRGRVLRLSKGKNEAKIYDFITLPRSIDEIDSLSKDELKYEKGLIIREYERIKAFNEDALNKIDNCDKLLWKLSDLYDLYNKKDEDDIV